MERPGWATFIGIFMLFVAGCGALDNFSDLNADQILQVQSEVLDEMENEFQGQDADTIRIDSATQKRLTVFGDSIVKDSANNVDVKETFKNMIKISDYRIKWIKNFAYIGFVICILFAISGIFFLSQRRYTIQLALSVLASSLVVGVFQFIVFRADTGSSKMISNLANFEVYWSIFLDIILLITLMVLDKSYYYGSESVEDYYDNE